MKAAIYARFSTENQRDASIEDQTRECRRLAGTLGLDVVASFEDRGISGGTDARPGYQALLAGARAGAFEVIVAEDLSRLWRSRAEYGPRSAELEDRGVNLVTCTGDDTRRDGWGLITGIKSTMAEYARRETSYRTRRGLEGKALAGKSTGGKTYGYDRSGAVSGAQAAIVRRIFEWAGAGAGSKSIAVHLNALGEPSPRGSRWEPSTVDYMLRNRRYTGSVVWGATQGKRSAVDSRRRIKVTPTSPPVERHDPTLQIIEPEKFDAVQRSRACRTF